MEAETSGSQDSKQFYDRLQLLGFFFSIFGLGLTALLATLPVKDTLGELGFAILLVCDFLLMCAGAIGFTWGAIAAQDQKGSQSFRRLTYWARTHSHWILWQLTWLSPLLVSAFLLGVTLTARDSKSDEIYIVWSLPISVGIISIGVVPLFLISRRRQISVVPTEKLRQRLRLAALITVLSFGVVASVVYWTVLHGPDIPVTDRMLVTGGHEMTNGGHASIMIPGTPPQRDHLALIPVLTNPANVGDCVNPALLDVAPMVDGQQRQPVRVQSRHEARLDLTGATHQTTVVVTLYVQDASCAVDLNVGQAVLYN